MRSTLPQVLDFASLRQAYADGSLTPGRLVEALLERTAEDPHNAWIHRLPADALREFAACLATRDPASLPLYGIPFAIKDNIDLAGHPTTAGCPAYAYTPTGHAFVVQQLIDAGAIPIGKTNLDQFATGLNGTRSPFGPCLNAINPKFISGGSSSGSAVAVALGQVSFALGTDTAGSGRVPAALNGLIGHKPSLGWLSARGVVPACRSLDTISVLALNAGDAETVMAVAARYDAADPFARPAQPLGVDFGQLGDFRLGVPRPDQREFFGDVEAARLFEDAIAHAVACGATLVEVDLAPFLEIARALYEGPRVAERQAAVGAFIDHNPGAVLPVIETIIAGGQRWRAADAYHAEIALRTAKRRCAGVWQAVDCVMTPTVGTVDTVEAMLANPIALNSRLGHYTNFMNLLDYAATALPAGVRPHGPLAGLPFGVTLFAPAGTDAALLHLAARLDADRAPPRAAAPGLRHAETAVVVCGAHLSGLPLNGQLTSRGGRLLATTRTAPCYRLHVLPDGPPQRPGLVRVQDGGGAIDVEVWSLPTAHYGSFVAGIPDPLGIGHVRLEGGRSVQGFLCEAVAVEGCRDITALGGWRAFVAGGS